MSKYLKRRLLLISGVCASLLLLNGCTALLSGGNKYSAALVEPTIQTHCDGIDTLIAGIHYGR